MDEKGGCGGVADHSLTLFFLPLSPPEARRGEAAWRAFESFFFRPFRLSVS